MMPMRYDSDDAQVDVEFSLALHNRTGKYFIGRDILVDQAALIGEVYYWRVPSRSVPTGLRATLLGRGLQAELALRAGGRFDRIAPFRSRRRMFHNDPYTVVHAALRPDDIVLCHDMGPITHPELFAPGVVDLYRRAYARIAAVGPDMVFVSEASRSAFVSHFPPAHRTRMQVIYPTIRVEMANAAQRRVAGINAPFLLTVGSLGMRKNQRRAIAAFARSGLAQNGWLYVICGGREPGADAVEALAAATPGVRHLPYLGDDELAWLYGQARGFVLVSLLEGFGVPVAEAMTRGLVPLVSRDSVLHEVAGDGALLADPVDEAAIAAGMRGLAEMHDDERARRRAALARSLDRFSRAKFARAWRSALAPRGTDGRAA